MKNALVFVGIGALIIAGGWYWISTDTEIAKNSWQEPTTLPTKANEPPGPPPSAGMNHGVGVGEENTVEFSCAGGKSMIAVFARDILGLTLSDGRQMTLRQAETGSGIRYLNNTETIEFRSQGDKAFLEEEHVVLYSDCVAAQ